MNILVIIIIKSNVVVDVIVILRFRYWLLIISKVEWLSIEKVSSMGVFFHICRGRIGFSTWWLLLYRAHPSDASVWVFWYHIRVIIVVGWIVVTIVIVITWIIVINIIIVMNTPTIIITSKLWCWWRTVIITG